MASIPHAIFAPSFAANFTAMKLTRMIVLSAALAFGACQRDTSPGDAAGSAPDGAAEAHTLAAPAPSVAASVKAAEKVQGWRFDQDYALQGERLPDFSLPMHGGGALSSDSLRGHWTILAFWGLWSDDSLADTRYMNAVASASSQDPDLDFKGVHVPPGPERGSDALGVYLSLDQGLQDQGGLWQTTVDDTGAVAAELMISSVPTYLLIGPDLTVEAWRPSMAAEGDDVVKPMFRGVAEIRKDVALRH
ncbi:MAG: hypothetical protein R3C52_04805 [Hyphomonadaceae bacterium]